MKISLINHSQTPMPRQWISEWLRALKPQLKRVKVQGSLRLDHELVIVFLDPLPAKKINRQYRKKNYATDILSFEGADGLLGELVLCPQVLKKQAKEQGHSFRLELGYMLIHGVLHLLGYDHELSKREAEQ
ncbi:MAG: rRNA maturation RNase YbeY, partial [Bdellovibrio sp. CG10_big_fil_rev_8_21_14_0_10_47_8]